MASPVTLLIVEGESRDLRFAEKMKDLFLKGRDDLRVICLPAAQNIYMLYERLAEGGLRSGCCGGTERNGAFCCKMSRGRGEGFC